MSKSELKRINSQCEGKTHFADDATLAYIRKLEVENERLNAEVAMLREYIRTKALSHCANGTLEAECAHVLSKSSSTWLQEHDKQVREECAVVGATAAELNDDSTLRAAITVAYLDKQKRIYDTVLRSQQASALSPQTNHQQEALDGRN